MTGYTAAAYLVTALVLSADHGQVPRKEQP